MAESELKIRVEAELSSVDKLSEKFRILTTAAKDADYQFRQGKMSADQLKASLADLQKKGESLGGTYKQMVDLNASLYQVQQRADVGFKSLGKSIDDLGKNIKQRTNPAFISFNQILQDAPYGIRGVGNNIEFMTQQFTQLRSSGLSTGQILRGMVQNLFTPMGGLMFAVSGGVSLLTVAMDHLGTSSDETSKKLGELVDQYKELHRLRFDVGKESEDQRRQYLSECVRLLQFAFDQAQNPSSYTKTTMRNVPGEGMIPFTETITPQKATADQLLEIEKQLRQAEKDKKDFEKQITDEKKKQTGEALKQLDAQIKFNVTQREFIEKTFATQSGTRAYGFHSTPKGDTFNENGPVPFVNVPKLNDEFDQKNAKSIEKDTADELRRMAAIYNSVFFDPMRATFDAIASGSQNMADVFIESIKRMIAKMIELLAVSAIFSAFGIGDIGTNFKVLSGISKSATPVSLEGDSSAASTGATTQAMSNSLSMGKFGGTLPVVQFESRISNDTILMSGQLAMGKKNVVKI